jgi:hypothetical protein
MRQVAPRSLRVAAAATKKRGISRGKSAAKRVC